MVDGKPNLAIRAAVMNCVARCLDSDTPVICLGDFLEKLAVMGWQSEDVDTVRGSVVSKLAELTAGENADVNRVIVVNIRPTAVTGSGVATS
jgi:hypothetical protein